MPRRGTATSGDVGCGFAHRAPQLARTVRYLGAFLSTSDHGTFCRTVSQGTGIGRALAVLLIDHKLPREVSLWARASLTNRRNTGTYHHRSPTRGSE